MPQFPEPPTLEGAALEGIPGVLRETCLPLIQQVAGSLSSAGHGARVRDLLDRPRATLSVQFRPWSGPLAQSVIAEHAVFQIAVEPGPEGDDAVVASCLLGSLEDRPLHLGRRPGREVEPSWVLDRLLDFVGRVLDRA